ncbi:hypothetical protein M2138_002136 [Dysgonomonadaceae bacterium PH5-43]|nr:hypothetical protein [Dysgonomonadaceae bacterium PH5-43]
MNKETEKNYSSNRNYNIVCETNKEIMNESVHKSDVREVSDEEIKQNNALLNPDPNSLDRG